MDSLVALSTISSIISLATLTVRTFQERFRVYEQVALEFQEVSSALEALESRCRRVGQLEVAFVSDVDAGMHDTFNLARSQRLLECTGLGRRGNRTVVEGSSFELATDVLNQCQRLAKLRQSIADHASRNQLILVCDSTKACLVHEALGVKSAAQRDWFSERIVGLVVFDKCFPRYLETRDSQVKRRAVPEPHDINRISASANFASLPSQSGFGLGFLSIPTIGVREATKRSCAKWNLPGCRTGLRLRCRLEIECAAPELADCTAWAILHLLQAAERDAHAQQILLQTVKYPDKPTRPASVLQCVLRNKTAEETSVIVEALQWVAFTLRPLDQQEFFEALGTDLAFDLFPKTHHETNDHKHHGKEVLHHCRDLLRVNENGAVDFHTAEMRVYVLSREFAELSASHTVDAHEMIATVCIRHLQCNSHDAILRPWMSSRCWLTSTEVNCHLGSYSITFWPAHCRIAQCSSLHLSAMLHQAIFTALAANYGTGTAEELLSRTKVNMGLEICSIHDLSFLGKTYLEMGADADGDSLSTTTPLTLAVTNSSLKMIAVLLDAGANPNLLDRDGYSALGLACARGNLEIARLLLTHGADPNVSQRLCSSIEKLPWTGDCTPLLLAIRYGHVDIVKVLLASERCSISSGLVNGTNNEFHWSPPPAITSSTPLMDLAAEHDMTTETIQQFNELALLDTHVHYHGRLWSPGHSLNQDTEQDSWQLVQRSDLDSESPEGSVRMSSATNSTNTEHENLCSFKSDGHYPPIRLSDLLEPPRGER